MIPAAFWRSAAKHALAEVRHLGRTVDTREVHAALLYALRSARDEHPLTPEQADEAVNLVRQRFGPFQDIGGEDGRAVADLLPIMLDSLADRAAP